MEYRHGPISIATTGSCGLVVRRRCRPGWPSKSRQTGATLRAPRRRSAGRIGAGAPALPGQGAAGRPRPDRPRHLTRSVILPARERSRTTVGWWRPRRRRHAHQGRPGHSAPRDAGREQPGDPVGSGRIGRRRRRGGPRRPADRGDPIRGRGGRDRLRRGRSRHRRRGRPGGAVGRQPRLARPDGSPTRWTAVPGWSRCSATMCAPRCWPRRGSGPPEGTGTCC